MGQIMKLENVDQYNCLYGLETLHPLISVIDLTKATKTVNHVQMNYGLYALYLKQTKSCNIKYGRTSYDYNEGTIVCLGPGQIAGCCSTIVCASMNGSSSAGLMQTRAQLSCY